ncbi:MAG: hypothetical protein ACLFTI_08055 [Anaerolineales bacterium]
MQTLRRWTLYWERTLSLILLLLSLTLAVRWESPPPQALKFQADRISAAETFNFVNWEIKSLARKAAFGLLAPQRWMDDETGAQFVLDYLDHARESDRLAGEIHQRYSDRDIDDPVAATTEERAALDDLRHRMERASLMTEAVLGEQVSSVLQMANFGLLRQILPPVTGDFTPLPYLLIISPRERIESVYQRSLRTGFTAADQAALEREIEAAQPDYAAYVTAIGGLSAYPSMLLESTDIHWITDVFAHEWTHHYLMFHPLGIYYMRDAETRTINETTASLMGEWAGQEVILRYYVPLLTQDKILPSAIHREKEEKDAEAAEAEETPSEPPRFDFRAEMHETRVNVDEMLAAGEIAAAEAYMEERRQYFVENGYQIRRLNQAYFAFHGAYASQPGGAAGEDPIGPKVRRLWALSESPRAFLRRIAPITTLQELEAEVP